MKLAIVGAHLERADVEPLAVAVPAGEVFLSAVEVESDRSLGDRELLLETARIRGALLERATFIAIRYGFAAASPAEAAARCAQHAARWAVTLIENRNNIEMTLKVAAQNPRTRPDRTDFVSGAEYLRALRDSVHAASVDPAFREAADRLLSSGAVRSRWQPRDERAVELTLLVPRAEVERFRTAGEALREQMPSIPFMLSGPWPLEVFADADHE